MNPKGRGPKVRYIYEECEKEKEDAEQEAGKYDEECEKEKEDAEQEAGKHDEDGEKEKENSDNAQQEANESDEDSGSETEEMLKLEQLKEKSRVQADAFWKQIAEEEEKEMSGDEEKVEESEAEEDEEKVGGNEARVEAEIIVASVLSEINEPPVQSETPTTPPRHGNQSDGTPTPPPRGGKEVEINEVPVESEKKEVREAVRRPGILLRCKEKTEMYGKPRKGSCKKATPTAGPKKRGRPRTRAVDAAPTITGKRKSEPSHWVQTPFTAGKKAGKKPKTKA